MRTAVIIVVGVTVWAACLGIAKFVDSGSASSLARATKAFVMIWFMVAALNLWVGVSQAGYSVREEFPIFLLIFAVPTVIAVVAKWKFL
jgi:hypothetical protein